MSQHVDLVGTADIARILGVSRAHATNRITKRADFPKPVVNLTQRLRRWKRADVERWVLGK